MILPPAFLALLAGCGSRGQPLAPVPAAAAREEEPVADADAPADPVHARAAAEPVVSVGPRGVLDIQATRTVSVQRFALPDGRSGAVVLTDLAPAIGVWFVLSVEWAGEATQTWHLENVTGTAQRVELAPDFPAGLVLDQAGTRQRCALWGGQPSPLEQARDSGHSYGELCDGKLALRNTTVGHKTRLEWTTDFLRDHVYGGERLTTLVKETLYVDAGGVSKELGRAVHTAQASGPAPARLSLDAQDRLIEPAGLALPIDGGIDGEVNVGAWYAVHATPGAWASVMQPRAAAPEVFEANAGLARPLDPLEGAALVYTVAFDLAAFELGYEVGTDHPRVGWSGRVPAAVHDASLPGPDGFETLDPLVRTGLLNPAFVSREVAVFVGGFKRAHAAFSQGELSARNGGSHYGLVEYGTVLSTLQPGLATLVVWADGSVELRTWTEADSARVGQVRHARQNGVAVLETDPVTGVHRPGALVRDWAQGNWSGSVEGDQRTVRGGVCVQDSPAGRYLLYSYFSSATPSAMADVYAAYGCSYAMHLDMNALEHTYLAVHTDDAAGLGVHHLVSGMEVLDRAGDDGTYARFVGYADNRDFFYLLRRP